MTSVELAALKFRLAEAELAYHQTMLGGAVAVVVDQNGERLEYSKASPGQLLKYISYLQGLIGRCEGAPSGPLGFIF